MGSPGDTSGTETGATGTGAAPERLDIGDGHSLAYARTPGAGAAKPGLVFLGGFLSDMTGTKALSLESFASSRDRQFLRFDYRGHGRSTGHMEDLGISDWVADALAVIDRLCEGPQILIGSSLGGWIMLRAALERPDRVAGLVGIAAAPDFTEDLMWDGFSEEVRATIMETGVHYEPSAYGEEPYPISRRLIEDGRANLLLRGPIALACPVRLLHGTADPDVPWQRSVRLMERLESRDVEICLIKDGDHRLSEPRDLKRLNRTLLEFPET